MLKKIIVIFSALLLFSCNNNQEVDEETRLLLAIKDCQSQQAYAEACDPRQLPIHVPGSCGHWGGVFALDVQKKTRIAAFYEWWRKTQPRT